MLHMEHTLEELMELVLQFLESKSFFSTERALRTELALALEEQKQDKNAVQVRAKRHALLLLLLRTCMHA